MNNFLSLLILIVFATLHKTGFSAIHDVETTRMKSTGGAGVGSFYSEEATLLNPAPQAFFKVSSLYFQKSGGSVSQDSNGTPVLESENVGIIASDSKGQLSGSVSYFKNEYNGEYRKRFATSLSAPISKKSALGFTYRQTKDFFSGPEAEEKYHQIVIGVSHLLSDTFNMGFVVIDPFRAREKETKAILGFQYTYEHFLSLLLDAGADYSQKLSDTATLSTALQLKVFNDFFIRFGLFEDKVKSERGSGAGAAWVGPKLTLNFALKNYTQKKKNSDETQSSQDIRETSFSLSMRF